MYLPMKSGTLEAYKPKLYLKQADGWPGAFNPGPGKPKKDPVPFDARHQNRLPLRRKEEKSEGTQ